MNIILFGPPGAGKGTQADKIVEAFDLHKVSTGDLLRKEIKNRTVLGSKIESIIDSGNLVSDYIINDLITNILSSKKFYNRLIFDGYPRNLNQAKALKLQIKKHSQNISCVFSLNVDRDIVIKRILGRQTCSKCGSIFNKYFNPSNNSNHDCDSRFLITRPDDNDEIIVSRYETYLSKTLPILNFYKEQNLLKQINGMNTIDQIFEEIRVILSTLQA